MTAKTLTDELRSVLLFHALEAPEPNATVDRILAETVGPVTALGLHDEAPEPSTGPRRRRLLSLQHLMAAAVVAVLLVSVAGINSVRSRNADQMATGANQDTVSQRQPEGTATNGSGGGSAALPPAADTSLEAKPVAPPYAGDRLDCSAIPGSKLTVGQSDDFKLSTDVEGHLFEYLCVGPDGRRSASEVQMFQLAAGKWQYVRTLPHPDAYEHLESMSAGSQVFLQFSVHRPGGVPGEIRQAVVDLSNPTDASSYFVVEPCLREHLGVTLTPLTDASAPSWRLSLRNQGGTACALEGIPQVRAQRDGATLTTATPTMNGPAGGVTRQKAPPISVLTQGATASAVIEQSSRSAAGSCLRSDQLAVTLPNGVALGQLAAEVAGCGLVVHPLVGNARGSD